MIKAAYGLNDAPRLWRLRLDQWLKEQGGRPLLHDDCVYIFYDAQGRPTAIISTHVDDIKGCAPSEWIKDFTAKITKAFGAPTVKERKFDHCGIAHEQLPDGTVIVD